MDIVLNSKVEVVDRMNHMCGKVGKVDSYSIRFDDYIVIFTNGWKENYQYTQLKVSE